MIGIIAFSGCRNTPSQPKEITIDSLYVDRYGDLTVYINNYQDTEECVRLVFDYFESAEYPAIDFITNKKVHI